MQTISFTVSGSSGAEYHVQFERRGDALLAYCTCQAGQNGQSCKHRIALLDGDVTAVISNNASEAAGLKEMLAGTTLASALGLLAEATLMHDAATKRLSSARKAVSRAMCVHDV